jgi:carbamoyltransferase
LQEAGLIINDLDHIAVSDKPFLKFERALLTHLQAWPFSFGHFKRSMPDWLGKRLLMPPKLNEELGWEKPPLFVEHHLAHAASAFLVSPFEKAAILTVDGVGEWASACYGYGEGQDIKILKEMRFPNSLGLLYTTLTAFLGFEANSAEGKIMALAEYGKPEYLEEFSRLITIFPDGSVKLNLPYYAFSRGQTMYSRKFTELLGEPRQKGEIITDRHRNIAATLQAVTEDSLLKMANHVHRETKMPNLCLAGGVFLNVTTNSRIVKETAFGENVFIQPAAGDTGGALGAAVFADICHGRSQRNFVMDTACLGPSFAENQIRQCLNRNRVRFREFKDTAELAKLVAEKIRDNHIVGWFQGRMEFGPRALGNRSILANPANPDMKDMLNAKVKHREAFRPFGVSVLEEECAGFCDLQIKSPYMLLVGNVKPEHKTRIPSAVHINDTSRIQTVSPKEERYYEVIKAFYDLTGIPMLINTSFNDNMEPIVCTPEDAFQCFRKTEIDILVMDRFYIEKPWEQES